MAEVNVPGALDEHERERTEVWREGITMALYVSLSQLAVMTALPAQEASTDSKLALTVALTSVGLVLAHQVAFRMSSRLVAPGQQARAAGTSTASGAAAGRRGRHGAGRACRSCCSGPPPTTGRSACCCCSSWSWATSSPDQRPHGRIRSLVYVLIVAVAVIAVLAVKSLVNH